MRGGSVFIGYSDLKDSKRGRKEQEVVMLHLVKGQENKCLVSVVNSKNSERHNCEGRCETARKHKVVQKDAS